MPEALVSQGLRCSGLVVMVKVMFIDESRGCCHHMSCAMVSIVVVGARRRAFKFQLLSHADSPPRSPVHFITTLSDDSTTHSVCFKPCSMLSSGLMRFREYTGAGFGSSERRFCPATRGGGKIIITLARSAWCKTCYTALFVAAQG